MNKQLTLVESALAVDPITGVVDLRDALSREQVVAELHDIKPGVHVAKVLVAGHAETKPLALVVPEIVLDGDLVRLRYKRGSQAHLVVAYLEVESALSQAPDRLPDVLRALVYLVAEILKRENLTLPQRGSDSIGARIARFDSSSGLLRDPPTVP